MNLNEPIAGEFDEVDDELVGAAEAILSRLDTLIAAQAQQAQVLMALAQQMSALTLPKRVVRDETGRIVGVEPVQVNG